MPRVLDRLLSVASLPVAETARSLDGAGRGSDNRLTHAVLTDGRQVLLRQRRSATASPRARTELLRGNGIAAPECYAADDSARLIDWDFPRVGYRLAELSALEEHAYLHGVDLLPPAFYDGYRRDVPADLLLAYRITGCLGWLAGDDWSCWENDPNLSDTARSRLRGMHGRLLDWADRIPDLVAGPG